MPYPIQINNTIQIGVCNKLESVLNKSWLASIGNHNCMIWG